VCRDLMFFYPDPTFPFPSPTSYIVIRTSMDNSYSGSTIRVSVRGRLGVALLGVYHTSYALLMEANPESW
jgi:hypothetical protein